MLSRRRCNLRHVILVVKEVQFKAHYFGGQFFYECGRWKAFFKLIWSIFSCQKTADTTGCNQAYQKIGSNSDWWYFLSLALFLKTVINAVICMWPLMIALSTVLQLFTPWSCCDTQWHTLSLSLSLSLCRKCMCAQASVNLCAKHEYSWITMLWLNALNFWHMLQVQSY